MIIYYKIDFVCRIGEHERIVNIIFFFYSSRLAINEQKNPQRQSRETPGMYTALSTPNEGHGTRLYAESM